MFTVVFPEEFLRKLASSKYTENFILKGGLLIYTLTNFESRATVDVDFLMRGLDNDLSQMDEIIKDILEVPTGNKFIKFETSKSEPIALHRKYHGVSVQITNFDIISRHCTYNVCIILQKNKGAFNLAPLKYLVVCFVAYLYARLIACAYECIHFDV